MHAVVNVTLAITSGKDTATAATGVATGELAGIIALDAWGIKDVSQLSEEQKQTVSALAMLIKPVHLFSLPPAFS